MTNSPDENPQLSEQKLEHHLYRSADKLRGNVEPANYKNYILPLLFFKRINDLYEEKYKEIKENRGEELARDPDFHKFQMPGEYHWRDIRNETGNVGEVLNKAFEELSEANPKKLRGVFRAFGVDWNDKEVLPNRVLNNLIEHFSKYKLTNENVLPNMLGSAYEYLIKQFTQEAPKELGEFYTPREIIKILVGVLDSEENSSVYDPTCGPGGMLTQSLQHVREKDGDPRKLFLYGQDINRIIWAMGRTNLLLHGFEDANIARGDTLHNPQFKEGGSLKTFDYVLANFPFSMSDWGKEELREDPYNRFEYGLPPKNYGDFAFIEHMIASLNETGKMGVVVPHGVLFRGRSEQKIRKNILEDDQDLLEAVIGLPGNLFYNNSIPCALLIINKDKPEERKGEVVFIHAADEDFYEELSNQNQLIEEGIQHIVDNFHNWKTEERVSRVVSLDEIRENDYNLNIALYVDTTEPEEDIDVKEEFRKLEDLQEKRGEIEDKIKTHMEALEYD